MTFGELLSKEFNKLTKDGTFCEVELFTKLQDAFINLSIEYPGTIELIHGDRSLVDFECTATYVPKEFIGTTVTRELSDMMFIVFSKEKNAIRLMYLQNKKGLSATKFKAELLQLNLLKERLPLIPFNLPSCVFGDENMLSNAILPSVASYGVFYQNPINQKTDMAYYPANNLTVNLPARTGKIRNAYYDEALFGKENSINGYKETKGEPNLIKFGNALIDMYIGTPILEQRHLYVLSYLKQHSDIFNASDFPFEKNNEIHFEEKKLSVPFVCIIDSDKVKDQIYI